MSKRSSFPSLPFVLVTAGLLGASAADARPEGPEVYCSTYPDSPGCEGQVIACSQCHAGPPNLNMFGLEVGLGLWAEDDYTYDVDSYVAYLPDALVAAEAADSDEDGLPNLEEIQLGTKPGDEQSYWVEPAEPEGLENPFFDVGEYDRAFAFKRVGVTFCGISPSYDEMEAFKQAADPGAALHEKLSACLESEYWKEEALHRMADVRIRPLKAVGQEGDIMLGDYSWDYRLFSHVLTGGRDARDLLLADYHVDDEGNEITDTIDMLPGSITGMPIRVGTGQPLEAPRRNGMITTQWFLVVNTMFTPLPRTTAAQAYRAYLGQDIAKGEGIHPVAGEPRDVDGKGVQNPTCAACHATLDPLAYAFASYNGIEINVFQSLFGGNPTGTYDENRTEWGADGVIFGQPVGDLNAWAEVAAESDEFKRNLVDMFWSRSLGHGPLPGDQDEFRALWTGLPEEGYSANAMLHRFIDTDAFGAP